MSRKSNLDVLFACSYLKLESVKYLDSLFIDYNIFEIGRGGVVCTLNKFSMINLTFFESYLYR